MLKTDVEKESRSLADKWEPLIDYLERNGKVPDEVLEAFMKLEEVVHIWSKKDDAEVTTDPLEVVELVTLTRKRPFHYEGSVEKGTTILFGQNKYAIITADQYKELINHFKGKTVSIGTSFTTPPSDSVGAWLLKHVSTRALASYVAPILIKEGYATLNGDSKSELVINSSVV
jgi:hypothetical protein